jgi:hypothetical protein
VKTSPGVVDGPRLWLALFSSKDLPTTASITSGLSWRHRRTWEKKMIELFTLRKYSSSFKPLQLRSLHFGGQTHVHGVEELLRQAPMIYNNLVLCFRACTPIYRKG